MNLNELTIKEAREKLDKGEISAVDLTTACLQQIEAVDKDINACLSVYPSLALAAAKEADKKLKAGEKGGLLGIPYLCKDIIMTKGLKTTAASKILQNYIAPYNATVIKKLQAAGAILLGKTNLDEFAHGASTENSAYGPSKNPHDLSRVPGGSSGGSAAAVAANMCLFALGSDTGGSVRQPASFCGVIGFKPSYGRVSRFGLLSMTSSTDVIGPITKSAFDAEIVLQTIAGQDEQDATTAPAGHIRKTRSFVKHQSSSLAKKINQGKFKLKNNKIRLEGLKIGLPVEHFQDLKTEVKKRVLEQVDKLKKLGAEIIDISLSYAKYGVSVYYLITPSEISSNLARFDGIFWGLSHKEAKDLQEFYQINRGAGFGSETKRRIMLGTYVLSAGYYDAYYKKAQAVRTLIIKDYNNNFKKVDFIASPTSPHVAFKLGEQINNPLTMYLEDVFVTGASLAGLPAISLPAGKINTENKEMPIGWQLIAPRFFDEELLQIATILNDH